MKFNDIPKFVINLDRRPDRLDLITKQMNYLGWDFERFSAIDTNSYMGITKSTFEIINIAKERGYKRVMLIEDDCCVMPYAKDLLGTIENSYPDLEYGIFNLAPTQNRPINRSEKHEYLLDLTNMPPAPEYCQGVFALNMIIYDVSVYDELFKIKEVAFPSGDFYHSLDDFIWKYIYPKYQSYCPILPIAPQRNNYSNISEGMYNNWYLQTYNWNGWTPYKIPSEFLFQEKVEEITGNNEHRKFYYVN